MNQKPVAIVAGAGRGIGRATAIELGQWRYRVALAARSEIELDETARHISEATVIPADLSQASDVERLIERTLSHFGRIDAIVNCVGTAPAQPIAAMSIDEWHRVINTNLSSAFYLLHYGWPVFERQKGGVVVNVSSLASRDPFHGFGAYGAAKAGLNLLGLSAAREGEKIGLQVHTIAPGAVETGMFRQLMTEEQWPSEKTLEPADVARMIVRCVAGDLRYTSGEVIFMRRTL